MAWVNLQSRVIGRLWEGDTVLVPNLVNPSPSHEEGPISLPAADQATSSQWKVRAVLDEYSARLFRQKEGNRCCYTILTPRATNARTCEQLDRNESTYTPKLQTSTVFATNVRNEQTIPQ